MSDLCLICYTNPLPKDRTLKCGFKVCEFCLISWVKAEAKYEFIKAGDLNRSVEDAISKQQKANYSTIIETLKCVNNDCQKGDDGIGENAPQDIKHRLTYEEVVEYVQHSDRADYKEDLDKVLFDILTPNTRNLIKCPRQGCDYVGYLNTGRKCTEQLECEKCNYSWSDPNLDPFCKKLRKCCCSWNLNFSLINDLQKVLRSQACPGCGICIIKGPGCKHMYCQKCTHEFCWHCLGDYFAYQHRNVPFCPFRNILKFFLYLYIFTFTVNLKFAIQYEGYRNWCIDAITIVGITLFANLITLTIFLEAIPIALIDKYKYDWSSSGRCCRKIAYLLACLYPLMWAAGLVLLYIYWDFARLMAWYLLWQWVGIIGIVFIVLITIWIIIFIQKKIREKRDREYNYEQFPYNGENYYGNDIEYGFNRLNQPLIPFPPPLLIPENRPLNLADSILAISEPDNTNDQNLDGLKRLFKDPDDERLIDSEDINVIDDNYDRQNLNDINRRRTLADIFLESRQNLRPRLASF